MWWTALLLAQAAVMEIQTLVLHGSLSDARTKLELELKQHPADPGLLNLLGVVEARGGNYARSEQAFRKAISGAPGNPAILLNLARLYQENMGNDSGAAGKAIEMYRQILRIEPSNAEARYQTAFLFMRQGSCEVALRELKKLAPAQLETPQALGVALACEPGADVRRDIQTRFFAHPRMQPADVVGILPEVERQKRFAEGRTLLEGVAKRHGATSELLTSLAKLSYQQKDYEATLGYLGHARDLAPADARIHFFMGMTAVAMNLVVEAKNSLAEAARLAPDNPYYHYALGAVLSEQRDAASAIPHFERYCRLRPEDPRGRFGIAVAYFQSNQLDEAEKEFRSIAGRPETRAGAHYFLGRIAKAQNRLEDAQRELLFSLELLPANLDAEAELAQVYQRLRKDELAEVRLRHVLKLDPEHHLANLTLLVLYQRRKDSRWEEQKQRVEKHQSNRKKRDEALWRTVEFRPY